MVPTIGVECLTGGFLILVVAEHDVEAADKNLSWDVLWVGTVNLQLVVDGHLATTAGHEVLVVGVADDGGAFCSTIAYGVGELDAVEERLYLLVECCAANDDLHEVATKRVDHLVTDGLAYLLVDDGHVEQQPHTVVLYLRKDLFLDDFLDDERHGNDDGGLHLGKCLGDDGGGGYTGEIEHMATLEELVDELKRHTVHMSHGKDAQHVVALLHVAAHGMAGKVEVAPDGAVGNHDAFGKTGGAAGVVDERQLIRTLLLVVGDMLLAEILGEFLTEHLVEVLTGKRQLVGARE